MPKRLLGTKSDSDFKRDMREEGWKLLEDVERTAGISAGNLELVSFLKNGEQSIVGKELVRRARGELRANLGQRDAEYLLEHQNEIPEELRPYILVFTGTIWCDRFGIRYAACPHWDGGRWVLDFRCFDFGFYSDARLVRSRE